MHAAQCQCTAQRGSGAFGAAPSTAQEMWCQESAESVQVEDGAALLLDTSAHVWTCSSQRQTLTCARLVASGLVAVADVLAWLFGGSGVPRLVAEDGLVSAAAFELLLSTFDALVGAVEVRPPVCPAVCMRRKIWSEASHIENARVC